MLQECTGLCLTDIGNICQSPFPILQEGVPELKFPSTLLKPLLLELHPSLDQPPKPKHGQSNSAVRRYAILACATMDLRFLQGITFLSVFDPFQLCWEVGSISKWFCFPLVDDFRWFLCNSERNTLSYMTLLAKTQIHN